MAVLKVAGALALVLAGCYRPEARDCTVTCQGADECLSGQVCGADGWCAAPSLAGTCDALADAGVVDAPVDDAVPVVDAEAPPPDGPAATLRVVVSGRGKVVIEPLGVECVGVQGTPGDCSFPVAAGSEVTLLPVDTHPVWSFEAWTTDNCAASRTTCVLSVEAPVTLVGASFQ